MASDGRRQSAIGLLDQGVFSATNFALTAFVAQSASVQEFGVFAVLMATYLICMFVARGLTSETYVVQYSGAASHRSSDRSACSGAALLVGLITGAALLGVGALLGDGGTAQASVFALVAPGLFLQDNFRYLSLASGRAGTALASDVVMASIHVPASVALVVVGEDRPQTMLAAWGVATCVGGAYAALRLRVLPRPVLARKWIGGHREVALRYAVDDFVAQATSHVATFVLAAASGLAAAGAIRAAQTVFGPLAVIFAGLMSAVTPQLVRVWKHSGVQLRAQVNRISVAVTAIALVWGAAVLLVPDALGQTVFGQTWALADPLLIWFAIAQGFAGYRVGSIVGLRATGQARRTLRARTFATAVSVTVPAAGALLAGAQGAAIALAISALPLALIWGWQFRLASR